MNKLNSPTRRDFLSISVKGMGAAIVSSSLLSCNETSSSSDVSIEFKHGVASGDPTENSIILWTRVTPVEEANISVSWEISKDLDFQNVIQSGETTTNKDRDYTVKLDAINLQAGTTYFYRFFSNGKTSAVGQTKTLPTAEVKQLKMAVMSCSNYPAGYFNVYNLASKVDDLDAVLHLGDYIYEYEQGGYASEEAAKLNREVMPKGELLTLSDYRTRYAQYRSDEDLQLLHNKVVFISVWDDHEVANDTYKDGAENHQLSDGDFLKRKQEALQAYFEWMPIRPISDGNELEIYRSFHFGDLVDLHMLDTRIVGRDKQLEYKNYQQTSGTIDETTLLMDINNPTRTMLGAPQRQWIETQLAQSSGTWQVLGQQVLMGEMYLPGAVALQLMSISNYAELGGLAVLADRAKAMDPSLTQEELIYLSNNQSKLTPEIVAQLQIPALPYNLDGWDGYAAEREALFEAAHQYRKNLVVIAGDTHNSWCSDLINKGGKNVGVEFATASVSSPGLEYYLNIQPDQTEQTEAGTTSIVKNLRYCNLVDRGFMLLEFSTEQARATWHYVDTILDKDYAELNNRQKQAVIKTGEHKVTIT